VPRDAIIENPVINSPFRQPDRHFRFDEEGITSDVVDGRRPSSYFVPIPSARKRGGQRSFETEWTSDRLQEPTANGAWMLPTTLLSSILMSELLSEGRPAWQPPWYPCCSKWSLRLRHPTNSPRNSIAGAARPPRQWIAST